LKDKRQKKKRNWLVISSQLSKKEKCRK